MSYRAILRTFWIIQGVGLTICGVGVTWSLIINP